jgi:hypothetical protein
LKDRGSLLSICSGVLACILHLHTFWDTTALYIISKLSWETDRLPYLPFLDQESWTHTLLTAAATLQRKNYDRTRILRSQINPIKLFFLRVLSCHRRRFSLSNTQHNAHTTLSDPGCEVLVRFTFASLFSIPHTLPLNSPFCIWSGLVCSGLAYITERRGEDSASYLLAFGTVAWRERDWWIGVVHGMDLWAVLSDYERVREAEDR